MATIDISPRLRHWIEAEFGDRAAAAIAELEALPESAYGGQDRERIQAAAVLDTGGDLRIVAQRCALARLDWRDLLMAGRLGDGEWPERLDQQLVNASTSEDERC